MDIQCMRGRGVFLADYTYMSAKDPNGDFANANLVLAFVTGSQTPQMPFGGPYWSPESLALLQSWIAGNCQP